MITEKDIQHKIDFKTKPIGALGELENIAKQICLIQNTLSPELKKPSIVVFAGDHGIALNGVSAYPQEVTFQMVLNFLSEGAAINVFSRQNGIELKVIDAGVNHDFNSNEINSEYKVAKGTSSFLEGPAMTTNQLNLCLENGEKIIKELENNGTNIVGFGEMGIANTSSASMLMHKLLDLPLEDCVGKGTGLNDDQLNRKLEVLESCSKKHDVSFPHEVLQTFGGFEIASMVGSMIAAAKRNMIVLVDGFIATAAYLVASKIHPDLEKFAIFCHQSNEKGHQLLLKNLDANPILKMELRLGEGTGCALAYPLIKSAVNFMNEMASFESAGVSTKE